MLPEKTITNRQNMAYLQTPIVKIFTGPNWIVFKRDDFQTSPANIARFLRLVEIYLDCALC